MKIVTWNVNSIKARREHVKTYLSDQKPALVMIQELKGLDFPAAIFKDMGYHSHAVTQKTYNGVATLSREPFEVIKTALPGDSSDEQARYLEIELNGIRLINIYLPNGNPAPGDKYDYKLRWMERLKARADRLLQENIPFLIGGDFNVIPEERDCYDPKAWQDDALFCLKTRQKFREIQNLGLTDAFRIYNHEARQYSFWDYQAGAWPRNNGIRIDHFLLSPEITDRVRSCTIDKTPRGWDKPSDHTPVLLEIAGAP